MDSISQECSSVPVSILKIEQLLGRTKILHNPPLHRSANAPGELGVIRAFESCNCCGVFERPKRIDNIYSAKIGATLGVPELARVRYWQERKNGPDGDAFLYTLQPL